MTTAQQIQGKIVRTNKCFSDFLSDPLQSNFFLTSKLSDEIQEIIKSLNSKKATGPNSIPAKILKVFSKTISIPLANLINLSFECGIFPMFLNASVTPTHKKGGSLDCNYYRPMLLISNLSKLIEKLVHNRFSNFLEKHKLLYEHQYGFQKKKHSTNHELIDITEKIRSALDQNIFASTKSIRHCKS